MSVFLSIVDYLVTMLLMPSYKIANIIILDQFLIIQKNMEQSWKNKENPATEKNDTIILQICETYE